MLRAGLYGVCDDMLMARQQARVCKAAGMAGSCCAGRLVGLPRGLGVCDDRTSDIMFD